MNDGHAHRLQVKTRKRRRNNNYSYIDKDSNSYSYSDTDHSTMRSRLSLSSLLWMFAAAFIASSPPLLVVHGQPTPAIGTATGTTTAAANANSNINANSNVNANTNATTATSTAEQQQESSTQTTNVRGGRGGDGKANRRSFVRQHQQQQQDNIDDDGDGDGDIRTIQRKNQDENHNDNNNNNHENENQHDVFLSWCHDSLGIDVGLVEIDHFGYPDYLRAMEDRIDIFCEDCNDNDDDDEEDQYNNFQSDNNNNNNGAIDTNDSGLRILPSLDDEDRYLSVFDEYPALPVRGLKASRDIFVGEVVLSIPHSALWTVYNAIDASGDPNLVESMGPETRQKYGWESPGMDEIPLLAITLLYHMDDSNSNSYSNSNPPKNNNHYNTNHGPYLDILRLQTTNRRLEESIPHLWSSRKLRKSATPSVRRVAKGIRKDVVELYESIVMVLIEDHPSVFGNNSEGSNSNNDENKNENDDEWMFSLEKFHWAFALVNSRHWHLPIPDDPFSVEVDFRDPGINNDNDTDKDRAPEPQLAPVPPRDPEKSEEPTTSPPVTVSTDSNNNAETETPRAMDPPSDDDHESFADQEGPPAATPTDEWVVIQDQKLREEEEREMQLGSGEENNNDNENFKINNNNSERTTTPTPHGKPPQSPSDAVSSSGDEPNSNDETKNSSGNGNDNDDSVISNENDEEEEEYYWPAGNSFLAPLADLLNFGPPCTRGIYNPNTMAFEIIATCDFRTGQEITFWYTDACEDVFMANYGFTMPMMVPKCGEQQRHPNSNTNNNKSNNNSNANANANENREPTNTAMWQQQQQQEQQQNYLEDELYHAYEELDRLDQRLDLLVGVLEDCHCGNQTELFAGARSGSTSTSDEEYSSEKGENAAADTDKAVETGESSSHPRGPGSVDSSKLPFPRSPSPPTRRKNTATTTNSKKQGGGPDARHAIRDQRNTRMSSSGGNSNSNSNSIDNNSGSQQQHQQRHRHHHSMTRFRSRRHQDRRYEF